MLMKYFFGRIVVKLFNVIQQAQSAAAAEKEEAKSHRGSGKPFLDAPSLDSKSKGKKQKSKPTGSSTNGELGNILVFYDLLCLFKMVNRSWTRRFP